MATSSVFPLEIYEHILELYVEDEPYQGWMMLHSLCYVCTAWRWKCRALGFRSLTVEQNSLSVIHRVRRRMTANPHLAALVEDVELRLLLSAAPYQSIVETFPSVLGRFLPRLRSVAIVSCGRPLYVHPHFAVRRVLLHTVTVLEVSNILFDKSITFEWFIAPFPCLRVLDMWSVTWKVASDIQGTLPALTELEIRLRGKDRSPAWMRDNREAYERLLIATRCTLRSLSINVFPLYILTSLHDYKSDDIRLDALEMLGLEVYTHRRFKFLGKNGKGVPYSQRISDMVSFLSRLDAKRTRILNLTFSINSVDCSVSDDEFLDCLRDVRTPLENLVVDGHFPSLRAINVVVVGAGQALVPKWQDQFDSCFPSLAEMQLLHVKEYVRKEYGELAFLIWLMLTMSTIADRCTGDFSALPAESAG